MAAVANGQDTSAAAGAGTYPQIVRIRSVEGDVRISRGKVAEHETGEDWEQAIADVPLETGYNLTTGDGRAEVEFEDNSTVYLGANSALALDDLHTSDGVPHTEMSLLTGTATLHLQPAFAGEMFVLKTPTDRIRTVYPNKSYERVTSYLDAVAITHLQESGGGVAGVTVFHNNGKPVEPEGANDPAALTAWDEWVAERVAGHEEAIGEVALASGLPASTPGLADMAERGVFYKCAPYGTCWEPTSDQDAQVAPVTPVGQGPEFQPKLRPSAVSLYAGDQTGTKVSVVDLMGFGDAVQFTAVLPQGFTCVAGCDGQLLPGEALAMQLQAAPDVPLGLYQIPVTMSSGPLTHVVVLKVYVVPVEEADFAPVEFAEAPAFPCYPVGIAPLPVRAPRGIAHYGGARGYAWGVCHAGTWIYRRHGYVWVAGERKHPHPPCRPVRCRGKVCWVPVHPRDEKGKLPVNWKHIVYRPIGKKGGKLEPVTLKPKEVVEPVENGPKEFLELPVLALPKADVPVLQAYSMKDRGAGAKTLMRGTELRFDHGTHNFLLTHAVTERGKTRVVTETFEEHRATAAARPVAGGGHVAAGVHGVAHAGGGSARASGGGAHASGTHAGGGGHASVPASHPAPAPAAHH